MAKFNCFSIRVGRKKKDKEEMESTKPAGLNNQARTLQNSIQHPDKSLESREVKSTTFDISVPFVVERSSKLNVKVMSHESPVTEPVEIAYEGEDELEENSIKRDFSDFDLHARDTCDEGFDSMKAQLNNEIDQFTGKAVECSSDRMIQSGHLSDPGIGKAEFWASPKLKRSCSNIETTDMLRKMAGQSQMPPSKSQSFEELREIAERVRKYVEPGSPSSVVTHRSADKVMLKKHSSSQILPSRSRRLWWKLFLWSHRNLHKPQMQKAQPHPRIAALNQQGGYCSDTLEPKGAFRLSKIGSSGSLTEESLMKGQSNNRSENQNWKSFQTGVSGYLPHNQWVAFPTESSSFARVNDWVNDLQTHPQLSVDDDDDHRDGDIIFPPSPQTGKSPERGTTQLTRRPDTNLTEEMLYANTIIQSLNTSSTVAHISGIGLKAIPTISHFSSLRSVNLSGNFMVHITPGSLPKGLHTLNLSRNKITAIEGLRDLTRLRVLDLSYNRISRIGQGLSNCTMIKELYLAANKISDVEGLHRLLKLTVLDLSFNRITTTKALGQLVANYNSLLALNLLGNPVQTNVSDDQLRKAVFGLLPNLVYLNKQPIKAQRAREVLTDGVAKAALGNSGWSSRRKASKRVSQGGSYSTSVHRSNASGAQKARHKSKGQGHRLLTLKTTPSSALASSSR